MTKTLEEAIGCWTATPEYNNIPRLARMVLDTAKRCKSITELNLAPQVLLTELELLKRRTESVLEITNDAIRRCGEIVEKGEVGP